MSPNESGGFTGYTLYPQPNGPTSQPWSSDTYTHVLVNADRSWITSTIYHELRHVLAGNFGRVAPYGAHHTGNIDQSTEEAEKEAVKNQLDVMRK